MAYSPLSLQTLARQVVNKTIPRWRNIFSLDIPKTLKELCANNYLEDKIYERSLILDDVRDLLNRYTFDRPYIFVCADLYIAIMNWNIDEIPEFAHEVNDITYCWYEPADYDIFDPDIPKYCRECMEMSDDYLVKHYMWDRVSGYDLIRDVFHKKNAWCSKCHTVTLFKIAESPYPGARRTLLECLENSSDSE
ncbi:NS3 [Solenopsis invicta densovirus]|uniref:NS3 n=1 Tax=Solenopsis invicta densovirus TaxID=1414671 RepID=U5TQX7_9VIRU|nr:NS3 [Solenopsis invicta densovirus]AGZ03692.1 NS3 [Solenopsis invicta densovirus]